MWKNISALEGIPISWDRNLNRLIPTWDFIEDKNEHQC